MITLLLLELLLWKPMARPFRLDGGGQVECTLPLSANSKGLASLAQHLRICSVSDPVIRTLPHHLCWTVTPHEGRNGMSSEFTEFLQDIFLMKVNTRTPSQGIPAKA